MKFTKGTFEIVTRRNAWQTRDGYVCGEFGINDEDGMWRVTHIPSGMAVYALERRTLAKTKAACIEALGRFVWNAPTIEAICAENKIDAYELRVVCSKMGE